MTLKETQNTSQGAIIYPVSPKEPSQYKCFLIPFTEVLSGSLPDISDCGKMWISGLDEIPKTARSCNDNFRSLAQQSLLLLH